MKSSNITSFFTLAVSASFVMLLSSANAISEEATRGLKQRVPVKPFFEEPRFKEAQPDPLETQKVLPGVPEDSKSEDKISNSPKLQVSQIKVVGSTIFSAKELSAMVSSYEGRVVSIDELQLLRHNLSLKYFQRGYVNSGVIIPDQDIKNGVVVFKVIEGNISNLDLSGNEGLFDSYILDRINLGISEPLNVNELQAALRNLQQNRLIKKINAQLKPAEELGRAELEVSVTEAQSKALTISVDNYRSPSVGAEEITFAYTDANLIGFGDALSLSASKSEGLSDFGFNYRMPLTANDTSLTVFYSFSDSEVIEEPFDQLDIESESNNYGFTLAMPVYKEGGSSLDLSFGTTLKDSDSFLLGEPFSFSAGAIEGESKTTSLEIGANFVHREAAEVYALSFSVRKGIDAFDSNISDDNNIPDSDFLAFLGQGQYARLFTQLPGSQIIFQTAFQKSLDPLLSLEKFSVGGHGSVRGYRENQLVRDNGLTASVEFRYAPFINDSGLDPYNFQIAPFLDWGRAWDEDIPSQDDESVSVYSAGIGFLWQPMPALNMELYWGEALEDDVKSDKGDDLQDDGIHFSLAYNVGF